MKKKKAKENKRIRVGVVVAIEIDAVLNGYGAPAATDESGGYTVRTYDKGDFYLIVA